jgi:hypothetical protein
MTPYYLTTLHVTCIEITPFILYGESQDYYMMHCVCVHAHVCVCVCVFMYININKYDMGILHHSCNAFLLFFHFRQYTYYGKKICIVSNLVDKMSVLDTDTFYMTLQVIDVHLFQPL